MSEHPDLESATWQLGRRGVFGGTSIAWDEWGDGEPVVLVHGFPGHSYSWRHVVPALARKHRVFAVDLRGFGASEMAPDSAVGAQAQAELLQALIAEWRLERPAVVAHDFGASVALTAAVMGRQEFRAMVLLDPATLNPCVSEGSMHARKYIEAYQTMPQQQHALMLREKIRTTMHGPMGDDDLEAYLKPWRSREGQHAYYHFLSHLDEGHLAELETRMSKVSCATLIVWGASDTWIPPAQAARLQALIPGSEVRLVADAGHFVMDDAPQEVASIIAEFLDRD